jgi:hypothetical protein
MYFSPVSTAHFDKYSRLMARGMADKLFFAERLDADVFVDFGCADGTLLEALHTVKPQVDFVGFDLSEYALHAASKKVDGSFFNDWAALEAHLKTLTGKTIALIASSVVHEVYAYGGDAEGAAFWQRVTQGPFDYFVMRDMALGDQDLTKLDHITAARVREVSDPNILADFEARWGALELRRNLAHFLLKYSYTDNWTRELNENYLPLTREDILHHLADDFDVELASCEILPFLAQQVSDDFGVAFPCPTHFKLIAKRR